MTSPTSGVEPLRATRAFRRWSAGPRLALVAVLAVATLALGLRAVAGPQTASAEPAQTAAKTLQGTWVVQIDPTNPNSLRLTSFAADGLMYANETPTRPFAPGEGPPGVPREYNSQGYGVWESRGGQNYAFKFLEVSFDDAENTLALVTITATVTLDAGGDSFTGSYTVTLTLPDGSSVPVVPSTPLTGTRVTLNSTP